MPYDDRILWGRPHHCRPRRKDIKQLIYLRFLIGIRAQAATTSSHTTSWKPSPTATSTAPPTSAVICNCFY